MKTPRVNNLVQPVSLADRVKWLSQAADLAAGRSQPVLVAEAKRVTHQVDRRLAFSGDATVVAMAGTTGSGKSSLFNGITGTQLARSSARRPTTDQPMAAHWGTGPTDLLGWLDVASQHAIIDGDPRFDNLVLVDLPDIDSMRLAHRDEVDRLIKLVDGVIWVLDPQKYADQSLHERYLRPLAPYSDVMIVVLNQCDRLGDVDQQSALVDLRALLKADGLEGATVLATSALTGAGIDDLRSVIAAKVASKKAAAARLSIDVTQAAVGLLGDVRRQRRRSVDDDTRAALLGALDDAAGLPQVVAGVAQAVRLKGGAAIGWPPLAWINRLRPDPLRLLRGGDPSGAVRLRGMDGAVAMARVDSAVRELSFDASAGLPSSWAQAVRQAATGPRDDLPASLDAALAKVDLGDGKPMGWWSAAKWTQWVLLAVTLVGVIWAVIAKAASLVAPSLGWLPWPALLIIAGLLFGGGAALVGQVVLSAAAKRQANQVGAALKAQVGQVADELVLQPVAEELARYAQFIAAVARAL